MTHLSEQSRSISVPKLRVVGLMSGTSLDGCDAVLTEISPRGQSVHIRTLAFLTYPMPVELRQRIVKQLKPETSRIDELCRLDAALSLWFVEAVESLMLQAGVTAADIDLIGSHGQTMWHEVNGAEEKMTWQLGDGSFIAARTGITTVCDFRTADVALGGQGAPLIPFFDNLLYGDSQECVALQNIGGIGNVTLIPPRANVNSSIVDSPTKILGFDTGPGNMIIDYFAEKISQGRQFYDVDGALAASGIVKDRLLQRWMDHPCFHQLPPKSTGREQFGHSFAQEKWTEALELGISEVDAIATATMFTAQSIAHSYEQAKQISGLTPSKVIVAGGGAQNITLMNMLQSLLAPAQVVRAGTELASESGINSVIESDSKEAVAFAVFAYQAVCGRSNHLPSTTGASKETILGKICPGRNYHMLMLRSQPRHYEVNDVSSSLPTTESRHPGSMDMDSLTAVEILELMNREDVHVSQVVASLRPLVASVAQKIAKAIQAGGHVYYVGAGTSGRLGVLDASEVPPTFSAPGDWFQGLIAGGDRALRHAVEGAEDNREQGGLDLLQAARECGAEGLTGLDIVIGIASSGSTPYVHGALSAAKGNAPDCHTVLLCCTPLSSTSISYVDTVLAAVVGPEILTGSTRMKAGTATKLILNQLSTVAMVLSGKSYGNLMVDVKVSNAKLHRRALRIIREATGLEDDASAEILLERSQGRAKLAIAMHLTGLGLEEAKQQLDLCGGRLGQLEQLKNGK